MRNSSGGLDPYLLLFPLGATHAVAGAALWVLYVGGWLVDYPLRAHAHIMVGGFLLSFASGFLLTAVPRFTGTTPVSAREQFPVVALLASMLVSVHAAREVYFFASAAAAIFLTVLAARRRFLVRQAEPPPSFLFVGAALLGGLMSASLLAIADVAALPTLAATAARTFFLKGMPLLLVIGIGSKLFPALTGAGDPQIEPASGVRVVSADDLRLRRFRLPLMVAFGASFVADVLGEVRASVAVLAFVMVAVGLVGFKLHKLPTRRSWVGRSVWVGAWLLCLSPLPVWFRPALATHLWHWLFIGGFGLLTASVSLRVAAAHGGRVLEREERRWLIPVVSGLILLAAATRVSAIFIPKGLLSHYAYAAWAWMLAYLLWAFLFVRMHSREADSPGVG